jgi:hypothetical protein
MKRTLLVILVIASVALTACGVSAVATKSAPSALEMAMATSAPAAAPRVAGGQSAYGANDLANPAVQSPVSADRLVIQNADLSIVVADVNARVKAIQDMATAMGGFVVSANIYQVQANDGTNVPQAQIVVRVPQEKLNDALDLIKQNTVEVKNETRSGQDVTDQYVDLQSRLTAKQAAEDQLLKIMQNATKTQDVLDVYAQLQQVQSDIEVLKGQIKYMEQSAALSAISVTIIAEATVKPIQVGGWKPVGVARDAIQSLVDFEQGFANFLIVAVLFILPMLITIGIPLVLAFLLLRWILRKTRRPRVKAEVQPAKS